MAQYGRNITLFSVREGGGRRSGRTLEASPTAKALSNKPNMAVDKAEGWGSWCSGRGAPVPWVSWFLTITTSKDRLFLKEFRYVYKRNMRVSHDRWPDGW